MCLQCPRIALLLHDFGSNLLRPVLIAFTAACLSPLTSINPGDQSENVTPDRNHWQGINRCACSILSLIRRRKVADTKKKLECWTKRDAAQPQIVSFHIFYNLLADLENKYQIGARLHRQMRVHDHGFERQLSVVLVKADRESKQVSGVISCQIVKIACPYL